jgi:predicted aldo/keto reductase-like oxidoreductase
MASEHTVNRRQFIELSSLGFLGCSVSRQSGTPSAGIKEYRTLGRTGFKVSDISSGTFNLNPALLDTLLESGVNYIDTSEYYYEGKEERQIGEVIKRHDRKSLFITDKLYPVKGITKEKIIERTRGCLERLQTDYLDCMMIAAVPDVEELESPGFHEAMAELKREGRVRFVGLSSHGTSRADTPKQARDEVLFRAIDDGRFDVFLIIYNFMARDLAETVLEACTEKKIGVTLMKTNPLSHYQWASGAGEDVEGGSVREFKEKTDRFLEQHDLRTPEELRDAAIRFVLANKNAHSVCVSFSNFDEVEALLELSGSRLSESDIAMLADYERGYGRLYCRHGCGVCEPHCPHHVPVNTIMRFNHYFDAQGRQKHAMVEYANLDTPKAEYCLNCEGHCERACPFSVPVRGLLAQAHRSLTLV